MSIYHDEVEIEDMEYDDESELYYYPCPCGDKFQISKVWAMRNLLCGRSTRSTRRRSLAWPRTARKVLMKIMLSTVVLCHPFSKTLNYSL